MDGNGCDQLNDADQVVNVRATDPASQAGRIQALADGIAAANPGGFINVFMADAAFSGALDGAGLQLPWLNRVLLGSNIASMLSGPNPMPAMAAGETRPAWVPKGWAQQPANNGKGTKYVDPNNPNNNIRIMKGDPLSPNPAQQGPYIKIQINGRNYDLNGNVVSNRSLESHIPEDDFDPEVFIGILPE